MCLNIIRIKHFFEDRFQILGRRVGSARSLHGQPSKNRQLLYQATHPQDVTDIGWEVQAPGNSSYASSLYELAAQNYLLNGYCACNGAGCK